MARYLCRNRHGTYYFRSVIPIALRKYFKNKRELRVSLKTDSKKVALPISRRYRVRFDEIVRRLASMTKTLNNDLDCATCQFAGQFNFDVCDSCESGDTGNRTYYASLPSLLGGKLEADGGRTVEDDVKAVQIMAENELERVLRMGLDPLELLKARTQNTSKTKTLIPVDSSPTWEEFSDKYASERVRTNKIRKGSAVEYKASYKLLTDFVGKNHKLIEIDVNLISEFYESLSNITVSTRNKHLSRIGSVFSWAVDCGVLGANPVNGVMTYNDSERKQDKREMFNTNDLKRVFESNYYIKNSWRKSPFRSCSSYTFWMFPLALFTGARMSELLLLERENIHLDSETPYIELLNEIDPDTGRVILKLKNNNSIRKIPIADALIDMGFDRFVRASKTKYLFPEIVSKETTTDAGQKALSSRLKKLGVWVSKTKSFHSFRHSFVNAAALSGVDFRHLSAVTGHLSKKEIVEQQAYREMVGTYFKGYPLDVLKAEVIDKLQFDVDFSGVRWGGR